LISIIVISKDEPSLRATLFGVCRQAEGLGAQASPESDSLVEVIVVDASDGRLDWIGREFPEVQWRSFRSQGVSVTIPHQRNEGMRAAAGDVVVFTDAGCVPDTGWLERLTAPIVAGEEEATAGLTRGSGAWAELYAPLRTEMPAYLDEAPTINLALSRHVIEKVGEFDESFEYGSDIDYSWRIIAAGFAIRAVPGAVVTHDWGSRRRQVRRSYRYGKARARLHRKHRTGLRELVRREPVLVFYPAFLIGLPLSFAFPPYLLLLALPLWRARRSRPLLIVVDHLLFGAGALREFASSVLPARPRPTVKSADAGGEIRT